MVISKCDVVDKFSVLLERVSSIEELPHTFDDTLVDRLIRSLDDNDKAVLNYVRKTMDREDICELSSVQVVLILQLVLKYNQKMSDTELHDFVERCSDIFRQERPYSVLSAFLSLLQAKPHICELNLIEEVFRKLIPKESVSIFIRSQLESLLIYHRHHEVVEFFVDLFLGTDSFIIRNTCCRMLISFFDLVPSDQNSSILARIKKLNNCSECVAELASRLCPANEYVTYIEPNEWTSELVRKEIAYKGAYRYHTEELINSVLSSPAVTLRNFVELIPVLSDEKLHTFLSAFVSRLNVRRFAPISELIRFIDLLVEKLSLNELASILSACIPRLMESPALLESLHRKHGSDVLSQPLFTSVLQFISEKCRAILTLSWEERDTLLEITLYSSVISGQIINEAEKLAESDGSGYVRASALRLLMAYSSIDKVSSICVKILHSSIDPQPKLEALKYLKEHYSPTITDLEKVIVGQLEDPDLGVRQAAVEFCALIAKSTDKQEFIFQHLLIWAEDPEIGSIVRKVLGKEEPESTETSLHILTDMLTALEIYSDEAIDCY